MALIKLKKKYLGMAFHHLSLEIYEIYILRCKEQKQMRSLDYNTSVFNWRWGMSLPYSRGSSQTLAWGCPSVQGWWCSRSRESRVSGSRARVGEGSPQPAIVREARRPRGMWSGRSAGSSRGRVSVWEDGWPCTSPGPTVQNTSPWKNTVYPWLFGP